MQKTDLEFGNVVETRNGKRYIYIEYFKNDLIDLNGKNQVSLDYYEENLIRKDDSEIDRDLDIMKVYKDYTLQKSLWINPKELLTQEEKDYLKAILKGVNCKCFSIVRGNFYVELNLENGDNICLARYNHMKLKLEGLQSCRPYTLQELGLNGVDE